ncbi:MAG: pectate lyase [Cellvibrio sp. 79]|nr:MAG: pectate lyase [Cellvibrio sp. 79]
MSTINRAIIFLTLVNLTGFCFAGTPSREQVFNTMKTASTFMLEKASYRGGFVWSYLPDFSRQWGELEAKRTMIWMQPPGTASVGHLMLDAYHATGDEFYYRGAQKIATAIIYAQHPSGGWNYAADYAGETSLKEWYGTIGKHAWRLEEFQHYYGNATFDDMGTADAAKFLLRLYLEKRDEQYRTPLTNAINFVLDSQYPIGGWPQRFPLMYDHPYPDHPDYSSFITFNDDVAAENIDFLLMCYQTLGEARVREPIIRAMNAFIVTQQGQPQPGWALQYTVELQPAAARSYEPRSLHTPTTAENIMQLIKFYRLTGDSKFLARIPETIDWLESLNVSDISKIEGRTHPAFIEVGTGKAIYTHRRGSNIANGQYYVDYVAGNMLAHYKSAANIPIDELRKAYADVLAIPKDEVNRNSPLRESVRMALPHYFTLGKVSFSDLNFRAQSQHLKNDNESLEKKAGNLISELNANGYWPTPLFYTTNLYIGKPKANIGRGDNRYANTMVGDKWDTSPYPVDNPVMGISTGAYIRNMGILIRYLTENASTKTAVK